MFPGKESAVSWSPEEGCLCKYVTFGPHVAPLHLVKKNREEIQCCWLPCKHLYCDPGLGGLSFPLPEGVFISVFLGGYLNHGPSGDVKTWVHFY